MITENLNRAGRRKKSIFSGPAEAASPFVRRIDDLINASDKTQRQIAREVGYDRSNIITMSKQGMTRVPLEKVAPLALSLGADPAELLRLWLETYEPDRLRIIEKHFGAFLSAREREWIEALRRRFPEGVPAMQEVVGNRGACA